MRTPMVTNYQIATSLGKKTLKVLGYAAEGGHIEICHLAIELGACDFDEMLRGAARKGHIEICRLAIELGADDFDEMLRGAARGGHIEICHWAIELEACDFTLWPVVSENPMKFAAPPERKSYFRHHY